MTMPTLQTPEQLQAVLPLTPKAIQTLSKTREQLLNILNNQDDRLLVIVGPCSIHNVESALKYAEKLSIQAKKHQNTLCIIMRAYIEKARSSTGWKGLINDPDLNGAFNLEKGLITARKLLLEINEIGIPIGTEILNSFAAAYFSDLISWAVIGARTTESQIHRELASYLSIPVGFKNNTSGNIQVAIDAVKTAKNPHHFLAPDLSGKITITQSSGNPYAHIVLRGSHTHSNYDADTINQTSQALKKLGLIDRVLIDCSHGNSQKDHIRQLHVLTTLSECIQHNAHPILGVMIESHLKAGKQEWKPNQSMHPEQSITDACIGWEDTETTLDELSKAVQMRRKIA